MESKELINSLLSVFFPEEISRHFEITDVKTRKEYIEIYFKELPELIPEELQTAQGEVVLDGFSNPLELQSFPIKGMPVYLKLSRRRWKVKGQTKHYCNSYDFNPEGVKATREFAAFLKDAYGQTPNQYKRDSKSVVHRTPKIMEVVSGFSERLFRAGKTNRTPST